MYPPRFPHLGDKMRNAERIFFDACANQLDDSWTVLYEVQWFGRRNQGNERGDADFLLMNSKYGIFCVEVKGGQQIFVKDNQWYTVPHGLTDAAKIRDPFAQAADSKSVLWSFLKEKIAGIQLSGALGHFVVFPGISIKDDISLSARKALICDKNALKNLPLTIAEIANALGQKNTISETQIDDIRKVIFPSCELISQSQVKVHKAKLFMDEMTQSQLEAFSMLNNWRELRVLGGAGTGKTSLAFYRAQQLAMQGAKILFLCNSSNAADYLRELVPDGLGDKLTVDSMETFFNRVADGMQFFKDILPHAEFLDKELFNKPGDIKLADLPNLSIYGLQLQASKHEMEVIALNEEWLTTAINDGLSFDGLVIDEAQNIPLQTVEMVSALLPNIGTRYIYIFGDRNQNIFYLKKSALDFEIDNPDVQLSTNCRSTAEIVSAAECLISEKREVGGAVGIRPVLFYHSEFKFDASENSNNLGYSRNQSVIVDAFRFLVERAELGIDADIQHVVIGGKWVLQNLRNVRGWQSEEFASVIDLTDWSYHPDTGNSYSPKNSNTVYLRKRTTLPMLVGLEVDGLIVELEDLLMSYGLSNVLSIEEGWASSWKTFVGALKESYLSCEESQSSGYLPKQFSPIEIAKQSESWSLILESYRRTIYSTMTRARLAVVFVGSSIELTIIKALLGDRCEEIYVKKPQLADQ